MAGGDGKLTQLVQVGICDHRCATILMERQALDLIAVTGLSKELLRQGDVFFAGDHPRHDVAAEKVHDHVQGEIDPSGLQGHLVTSHVQTSLGRVAINLVIACLAGALWARRSPFCFWLLSNRCMVLIEQR